MTTIAAVATPTGNSGVGIIRLSGADSLCFALALVPQPLTLSPRVATLTKIQTPNLTDEALLIHFPAPHSFTGEDVVEIQAHGGSLLLQRILDHLVAQGATPARAGEFSKRAFLNGKMSLSAAEAIIDLINAESDAELKSASSSFNGRLIDKLTHIEQTLTTLSAQIEVILDDSAPPSIDIPTTLQALITDLATLIQTENQGRLISNGVQIAVLGKPNVGKSSLFNALLGRDRAIVTNIAGTTTDTISESIHYQGYKLIFNDTAGIHDSKNEIEKLGIERSKKIVADADICLVILDASLSLTTEDLLILELLKEKNFIIAFNKYDLLSSSRENNNDRRDSEHSFCALPKLIQDLDETGRIKNLAKNLFGRCCFLVTSAMTGKNVELIKHKIFSMVVNSTSTQTADLAVTNTRHLAHLKTAHELLSNALSNLNDTTLDLTAVDIALALTHIGQISGTDVAEGTINEIFSRFCLGK
ncbi:MAG: tRNA uridine-5-carboxymethylaminomethyl(34) synthesis GTPase MnmE [Firmicutes bacterium]|nr:tRNA uridine-5-carboxymethylaminomethyl(34) synthesis GTPase MnmE [Bacillota bacterium]